MSEDVLERRYRRLLALYPRAFRCEHEEEMLGVLLAGAGGRRSPGVSEVADLLRSAAWMRFRPGVPRSEGSVFAAVRLMYVGAAVHRRSPRSRAATRRRSWPTSFPPTRRTPKNTYLAALSSWPPAHAVPARVLTAQSHAVDLWWAGADPAGKKTTGIAAPTLVADGSQDPLDPVANSRALPKLIPHAQLVLYPDAAHAFLFQESGFATRVEAFLG